MPFTSYLDRGLFLLVLLFLLLYLEEGLNLRLEAGEIGEETLELRRQVGLVLLETPKVPGYFTLVFWPPIFSAHNYSP